MFLQRIFSLLLIIVSLQGAAQTDSAIFANYTTVANRTKFYENTIKFINKALSLPLNNDTEQNWEDAFSSIEVTNYKADRISNRILYAFDSIAFRTPGFQRALLEFIYTDYPKLFTSQVKELLIQTPNAKIFAMCAEYLLQGATDEKTKTIIKNLLNKKFPDMPEDAIVQSLSARLHPGKTLPAGKILAEIFSKDFLSGNVVMYSLQRKNRDYPGIVIVRDRDGKFVKDDSGKIFSVAQLARSITNLPYYLTNGNTPQGIFRMYGFDVSKSMAIGPTTNIQLTMPAETSLQHFMRDSTITDSTWTQEWYKKLLPEKFKDYQPLYESFYAGKAGRTEIISHGTAVDPGYYKGKTYYPYTPTEGCLCTKELWNGKRTYSDQQKLVNALQQAGGADGYCVVIELDDADQPVNINEVMPFIRKAEAVK